MYLQEDYEIEFYLEGMSDAFLEDIGVKIKNAKEVIDHGAERAKDVGASAERGTKRVVRLISRKAQDVSGAVGDAADRVKGASQSVGDTAEKVGNAAGKIGPEVRSTISTAGEESRKNMGIIGDQVRKTGDSFTKNASDIMRQARKTGDSFTKNASDTMDKFKTTADESSKKVGKNLGKGIGKGIAIGGAAAVGAVAAYKLGKFAGKKIIRKMKLKQYNKWKEEDPKKRSDITFSHWEDLGSPKAKKEKLKEDINIYLNEEDYLFEELQNFYDECFYEYLI